MVTNNQRPRVQGAATPTSEIRALQLIQIKLKQSYTNGTVTLDGLKSVIVDKPNPSTSAVGR